MSKSFKTYFDIFTPEHTVYVALLKKIYFALTIFIYDPFAWNAIRGLILQYSYIKLFIYNDRMYVHLQATIVKNGSINNLKNGVIKLQIIGKYLFLLESTRSIYEFVNIRENLN